MKVRNADKVVSGAMLLWLTYHLVERGTHTGYGLEHNKWQYLIFLTQTALVAGVLMGKRVIFNVQGALGTLLWMFLFARSIPVVTAEHDKNAAPINPNDFAPYIAGLIFSFYCLWRSIKWESHAAGHLGRKKKKKGKKQRHSSSVPTDPKKRA